MRTLFFFFELLDIITTFLLRLNKTISGSRIPAVKMAESQVVALYKLHRLFRFYDPEIVAVLTILLGLFQVLLGFPTYYMSVSIQILYMCPVFVGAVYVAVGSFAMASERSPSRTLLKSCLYSSSFGLLVGLSAIVVYSYAISDIKAFNVCPDETFPDRCPQHGITIYFNAISALLLIYDIGALPLHLLLLFSAMKGLKSN